MRNFHFDPFSAEMHMDPYPTYAWLRDNDPIHYSEANGFWVVSRWSAAIGVLRDWKHFSSSAGVDIDSTGEQFGPGNILEEDPPPHDVHRGIVRTTFIPKNLKAALEQPVRREVAQLLDRLSTTDFTDFAAEFAYRLPVAVAGRLLGIPECDHDYLRELELSFAVRTAGSPVLPDSSLEAAAAIRDYFRQIMAERRKAPREDLLTLIATAEVDGAAGRDGALGLAFILFDAAIHTSASSILNALHLLAAHPEQRQWLARNLQSADAAFEEVVRYEAPVQSTKRLAMADVDIGGVAIPRESIVVVLLGSANRDERRFADAGSFDIRRDPLRHVGFGEGIHHCIGAPLARLEGSIALSEVLRRAPEYELEAPPTRLSNHIIRSFSSMPMRLGAGLTAS